MVFPAPNEFTGKSSLRRLLAHLVENDPVSNELLLRTSATLVGDVIVNQPVQVLGGGNSRHAFHADTADQNDDSVTLTGMNGEGAFNGNEITVFNDGVDAVYINFNAAAVPGSSHELRGGEAFVFELSESNGAPITTVHYITDPGNTVAIRIHAFGTPPAAP